MPRASVDLPNATQSAAQLRLRQVPPVAEHTSTSSHEIQYSALRVLQKAEDIHWPLSLVRIPVIW